MPAPKRRTAEAASAPGIATNKLPEVILRPRVYCDPAIPADAAHRERRLREANAQERRARFFDRKSQGGAS